VLATLTSMLPEGGGIMSDLLRFGVVLLVVVGLFVAVPMAFAATVGNVAGFMAMVVMAVLLVYVSVILGDSKR